VLAAEPAGQPFPTLAGSRGTLNMAAAASTSSGDLKGCIMGLGNPLLDISAEVDMALVEK
jgi:hypothetical protein